ncbi:MAG: galactitol-1-phosphate 5-dehydrogenase [Prolixibacteraceae bacterium]|nr:galactitol-1-phosphate 5-dehydrogenase [Prolixibacteraceae bacterium]
MKALVLDSYNELNYRDFPDPVIQNDEVLIEVKACGICGSDVHGMDGSTGRRIPPIVMGHEASGVIIETGSEAETWKIGDRVTFDSTIYPLNDWFTLNGRYNLSDNRQVMGVSPGEYRRHGAFAEKVAVPQHILYHIPSNVTFVEAAMVEPIAVAAHAINVAGLKPGSNVIVAGAGMVGIFVIKLLKLFGANKILVIDIDQKKLNLASEYGADVIINPGESDTSDIIKKHTKNRGADLSFEVVGIEETVNHCVNNTRKGGTVVLVGNLSPQITFPLQKVVTQEMSILGSCAIKGEYELVLELLSEKKVDPAGLISAVAPLSEGADWFKRLYNKEKGLNKVILTP